MRAFFLIFFCLLGCKKCPEKVPPFTRHPIQGREEILPSGKVLRRPLYKADVPIGWKRLISQSDLSDTTKPNATFQIEGITLTIHTFPTDELSDRIPPAWQVERWQQQAGGTGTLAPQHRGGFVGLFFETPTTLAWSFQLDPKLYQTLAFLGRTDEERAYFRQMRSDFTVKATGPAEQIAQHREEILFFVDHLALFQPIPAKR